MTPTTDADADGALRKLTPSGAITVTAVGAALELGVGLGVRCEGEGVGLGLLAHPLTARTAAASARTESPAAECPGAMTSGYSSLPGVLAGCNAGVLGLLDFLPEGASCLRGGFSEVIVGRGVGNGAR